MGIFDLFRKKRKHKARNRRSQPSQGKQDLQKFTSDIEGLQAQVKTVHIALEKHDNELSQHSELIKANSEGLKKLEEIVEESKIKAPVEVTSAPIRPVAAVAPSSSFEHATQNPPQKFDINCFSEQERRIVATFFHNRDMALSYVDIAKALNKSPHTVKNQMNQMRFKADLFNRSVGRDCRKRFRLKNGLKIEKYLNVG